ncbi:DEKNAAC105276 [Brettanomyces naardenensis]|uniref:mRNA 3'-end-processing protein n=1 Tax=Brettanomyces naardenensis TaxID=13370 RepID=A0A448YSZ8_BRENA|nr:DEKNAAC105276 [Brettanomyces naardenensis]
MMGIPARPPTLPQGSLQQGQMMLPAMNNFPIAGGVPAPAAGGPAIDLTDPTQVAIEQEYRMLLQQMVDRSKKRVGFKFEPHLRRQFGFGLDPDRPICPFWINSNGRSCPYQSDCPFKHPSKIFNNKIVCKYWLRGLCKMGDDCDFLHEYNLSKMPECAYYAANGVCLQAGECIYLHVDPQSKIPECWNYSNLGFCPEGPKCPRRHVRKVMCPRYLAGVCPEGPACELAHPKYKMGMNQLPKFKIVTDEEIIAKREQDKEEEDEDDDYEVAVN